MSNSTKKSGPKFILQGCPSPRKRPKRGLSSNLDLTQLESSEKKNLTNFVRNARNVGTQMAVKQMFGNIITGNDETKAQLINLFVPQGEEDSENSSQLDDDEDEAFSQASSYDDIESSSEDEFCVTNESQRPFFSRGTFRKVSKLKRTYSPKKKSLVPTRHLNLVRRRRRATLKKKSLALDMLRKKYEQEKKKKNKRNFLIKLDGNFKIFWDNLSIFLIIYIAMFSPFKISFIKDNDFPLWDYFDVFIDLLFLMDIILNFFTPIYLKHDLITSHKLIAKEYFKLWFWIDLVSILPFQAIFDMLSLNSTSLLKLTKMPRLYRLVKISKLIRAMKMKRKGNTLIGKLISRLFRGDSILVNILPLWLFGALIAYIFGCIWHFVAILLLDPSTWLIRYDYYAEETHDKFWASMYYIYSTMTTTGYGDIVPGNKSEYLQTSIFMAVGVTFHSIIYTTILRKIEEMQFNSQAFAQKKEYLTFLKEKAKLFKSKKGKQVHKEILTVLDKAEKLALYAEKVPIFSNVRPKDVKELKLQVCERKYRFDKVQFFKKLPKKLWLRFYEKMEKRYYQVGDLIYDKGSVSTHFFVIRKGKVFFLQSEEKDGSFPFMEVDSYFGEFELFDDRKRRWTVMAASKSLIIYTISKIDFFEFFRELKYRVPFLMNMTQREENFNKADRECGRAIRRAERAHGKAHKLKKNALKNTLKTINKAKREAKKKGHLKWHEDFVEMRNDVLEPNIEKEREKQINQALGVMAIVHKKEEENPNYGFKRAQSKKGERRGAIGINLDMLGKFHRIEQAKHVNSLEKLDKADVVSVTSLESEKGSKGSRSRGTGNKSVAKKSNFGIRPLGKRPFRVKVKKAHKVKFG